MGPGAKIYILISGAEDSLDARLWLKVDGTRNRRKKYAYTYTDLERH